MNETEIVIGRCWRVREDGSEQDWQEQYANSAVGFTMGPFPFDWIFEVERCGRKDRVNVPAGVSMTWEPLLP